MTKVLVIAPHSDDELFGAGGFLLRAKSRGWSCRSILVTSGDIKMHHRGLVKGAERREEFTESVRQLCNGGVVTLDFPDSKLDTVPIREIVSELDLQIDEYEPDWVLFPEPSYHQDHQVVHRAAIAALRPTGRWSPDKVAVYEVPTSTWSSPDNVFTPNLYVDVTPFQDEKERVFREVYNTQYTETDRGALALSGMRRHAKYRGVESGCEYAEAFMVLREVLK